MGVCFDVVNYFRFFFAGLRFYTLEHGNTSYFVCLPTSALWIIHQRFFLFPTPPPPQPPKKRKKRKKTNIKQEVIALNYKIEERNT